MIAIENGKIVTPDAVLEDKILLIENDKIVALADSAERAERTVNAHGRFVMPGLIDVHSDKIEHYIQPRPTSHMDFELAIKVCERDLLNAGITTMFHSISLFQDDLFGTNPLRTRESVQKFSTLVKSLHERNHLIHHRFHLRIEIDNLDAYDIAREMIAQGKIQLISFMDHTPGQGQYRDLKIYRDSITGYKSKEITELGFDAVMERHKGKEKLSFEQLQELADFAHSNGIPVASHDDDTDEKLAINAKIGVDISEFPITLPVAKSAKERGFTTVVGAANILRGCSHSGNLSAGEAILEDCGDIICSDYYPAAILHSIFWMHRNKGVPLPQMVNRGTQNPAEATFISEEYGAIEVGKKADLLVVDMLDGYPVITHVFVDGNPTSRIEYRR